MSGSEGLIEVVGSSNAADPIDALRDALTEAGKALAAAGCGPQHMTSMRWEAADPLRFHPSRHEIELAQREVFAGFRPPVSLRRVADVAGLRAVVQAKKPASAPGTAPVYHGYAPMDLVRQYSPRFQTDMNVLFKQWSRDGEQFRARFGGLDLCYGPGRYETFDIFLPDGIERPPVFIFVHGGYWQASDKNQHAQFARGMLDAGFAVVMANYGLAPENSLPSIVDQITRLLAYLVAEADSLGIDGTRLHIAGHSAGGHIAGMIAARGTAPTLRSALLLSGVFDLEPLTFLPMGAVLKLTPALVAELSPLRQPAPTGVKIGIAVGDAESDEFKRQSQEMAAAWRAPDALIVPGHHFSMLEGLNGGALLDLTLALTKA
jgi:arylformamidase